MVAGTFANRGDGSRDGWHLLASPTPSPGHGRPGPSRGERRVDVRGSVCLVTGGSSGIGRALAVRLTKAGARVIAVGRDPAALADLERSVRVPTLRADLSVPEEIARCARDAMAMFGRVDVLVNNAGIGWAGPFVEMDPERAERLVRVNLTAPILLTRALIPAMRSRGRGWVVNVASIAGHVGVREEAVYAATKAALLTFGESIRYEVAGAGIGVTNVSPGVVRTAFFDRRGRPYDRGFPRPISADRVARAVVRGVRRGADEVFVPRWMRPVARFHGWWPGLFRQLAGRFG